MAEIVWKMVESQGKSVKNHGTLKRISSGNPAFVISIQNLVFSQIGHPASKFICEFNSYSLEYMGQSMRF